MTSMNTGDWISAAAAIVQAAAIVVGAGWAYFKFVRGRTFHHRAELAVEASLFVHDPPLVMARASMKNTGGSVIPLRAKTIRVATLQSGKLDDKGRPVWQEVAHASVFNDHDWIESQETIDDEVLIAAPSLSDDVAAVAVTCVTYEDRTKRRRRRKREGGSAWTDRSLIPLMAVRQASAEGRDLDGGKRS